MSSGIAIPILGNILSRYNHQPVLHLRHILGRSGVTNVDDHRVDVAKNDGCRQE